MGFWREHRRSRGEDWSEVGVSLAGRGRVGNVGLGARVFHGELSVLAIV